MRTTVFLKGCPLACAWCHNPESQAPDPELTFRRDRCTACGACVSRCPRGAVSLGPAGEPPLTDRARCTACGACVAACPARARAIVGRARAAGDLLAEIERDVLFYDQSGGGVTLSGGEPLAQWEFASLLLRECCKRRIHTALDTCGFASEEAIARVAAHVDLFLYDIKLLDDERHRLWTGVSNAAILANCRRLSESGKRLWIRYPLIPGVNDSDLDLRELGHFVATLSGVEAVQILPYHAAGEAKRQRLGRRPEFENVKPPAAERVDAAAALLGSVAGTPVRIGG